MENLFFTASYLAFLAVVLSASPADMPDPDVQRLIKVDCFAFGGIGYAGMTSEGESAFAAIVQKKEAIRYIAAVFQGGSQEARCYALVAMRELSPPLFAESLEIFRRNAPKTITTMRGCVVMREKPLDLLARIEHGDYAEWFKKHERG